MPDLVEPIDEHFTRQVRAWLTDDSIFATYQDPAADSPAADRLRALFDAQVESRQLDLAARWLQRRGLGYYTIGSAGHESDAAVALALRPTDPALLHYRSGGFYAARARQVAGTTPIKDVLCGLMALREDQISGGRHKVFGNRRLSIIPQTSTIASHLPRAVGLAFAIGGAPALGVSTPWPTDSIAVVSFGDASINHSTFAGALNAAAYCVARRIPLPLLLVCEDNGWGISTPSPPGWVSRALASWPGITVRSVDGFHAPEVIDASDSAVRDVRDHRQPVILHLKVVRFGGHAGSDAELGYRSHKEIHRDFARDPLIGTAATLIARGVLTPHQILQKYENVRQAVHAEAEALMGRPTLGSAADVMAPLAIRPRDAIRSRRLTPVSSTPGGSVPVTLAGAINATLADVLETVPQSLVFGEDVAAKGGVYGVTRGLRRRFGGHRVFDTLLDEQTILGTALGASLAGLLPLPEIQYLAYLHNAEDQLRGEAASLAFFSNGQYHNGMVVRVPGLGYQRGFGGHFHNDNSITVLRDIPGIVVAVPSHPAEAPTLLRACVALALEEGTVCVFLEPIALYHDRDLHEGDGSWQAPYLAADGQEMRSLGTVRRHGTGMDLLIVTFGNGVRLSLRAAQRLADLRIACSVIDLRWLVPLPVEDLLLHVRRFEHVLVVDETRAAGGVAEGVLAALVDGGFKGQVRRVCSKDSFVPLGPAARLVLPSEEDIVTAATDLLL